jgi:hypothetical protein
MSASLDLALIGNCTVGALLDARGRMVWGCFPRFDGDPVFCSLLDDTLAHGYFDIELVDFESAEQAYVENTAILRTRLVDTRGGCVEITDFAPRFGLFGRMFRPTMLVRRLRRINGSPRLRVRLRPACDTGRARPTTTWGSNHVRYVMPTLTLRLTTDLSITAIQEETPFFLEDTATLLLGPDETVHDSPGETGRRFLEETERYWQEWVRFLGIPFEWQEAVIRAAITLKLNAYDDTGAIIAAMTTSIPEAAGSQRNWDYRYCWLRDGYFVVNALNRLGATRTMERYLGYIVNVVADAGAGPLQPVFGIDGRARIDEHIAEGLAGYRGMGPVRIGNQAYAQVQHDVYGSAVLAATHIFFDQRLTRRGDETLFHQLEALGERAAKNFDQPDAGLWELRNSAHVHTFSSVMCWAACDRLARIAAAPRARRARDALARHRPAHSRRDLRTRLELEAQLFHLDLRRRRGRRQPAAAGRGRFPRRRRSALFHHRGGDRTRSAPRWLHFPLRRCRRLRRAGERLPRLQLLVCQRAGRTGAARRGARTVRKTAGAAQPPWPAGRAHRSEERRAVGQFRPDLQHGRSDQRRDPPFDPLGPGILSRSRPQKNRQPKLPEAAASSSCKSESGSGSATKITACGPA